MNKIEFNFKDRTAIITGGAQGFGLDIAKKFLDYGAKVRLWDIDEKELKKVKNKNIIKIFARNFIYIRYWQTTHLTFLEIFIHPINQFDFI